MTIQPRIAVTFLRHGRSRADDEGVHEGRYDSPLTEVGRRQALARGSGWKDVGLMVDEVICSPLKRAHETAAVVAETAPRGPALAAEP